MSLTDVIIGQQSWTNYVSNRDLADRVENSLTKVGDRMVVQLSHAAGDTAMLEGLGSLESGFMGGLAELQYELQDISGGIAGLRADFHILMGDVVWALEKQTSVLDQILRALQLPLDNAAKELRLRAETAYRNKWYREALSDFLESEEKSYQDFAVHRSLGNLYFYHIKDLLKAVEYFQKAAKYARPYDSKQAAEAEYFTGLAFGTQQDYDPALRRMREATSLDDSFYEAYYMSASFAALLGRADVALDSAERAILGDARYYKRSERDPCFDRVRSELAGLRSRLLRTQEEAFQQALQRLRDIGIDDLTAQRWSSLPQACEKEWRQGHYAALRFANARALQGLVVHVKLAEALEQLLWTKQAVPTAEEDAVILDITEGLARYPSHYDSADRERLRQMPTLTKAQQDLSIIQFLEHELADARQTLPTPGVDIGRLSERLTEVRDQLERIAQRSFQANVEGCQFAINQSERHKAQLENLIESLNQTIKETSGAGMGWLFFFLFFLPADVVATVVLESLPELNSVGAVFVFAAVGVGILGALLGRRISRDKKNRPHRLKIEEYSRSIDESVRTLTTARARLEVWKQNLSAFQTWQARRTPPLPLPTAS